MIFAIYGRMWSGCTIMLHLWAQENPLPRQAAKVHRKLNFRLQGYFLWSGGLLCKAAPKIPPETALSIVHISYRQRYGRKSKPVGSI